MEAGVAEGIPTGAWRSPTAALDSVPDESQPSAKLVRSRCCRCCRSWGAAVEPPPAPGPQLLPQGSCWPGGLQWMPCSISAVRAAGGKSGVPSNAGAAAVSAGPRLLLGYQAARNRFPLPLGASLSGAAGSVAATPLLPFGCTRR